MASCWINNNETPVGSFPFVHDSTARDKSARLMFPEDGVDPQQEIQLVFNLGFKSCFCLLLLKLISYLIVIAYAFHI